MKYLLEEQQSERLNFRKLEETDFEWWMEFSSHPEATRYFDFSENIIPEEFCKLWFKKVFDRYKNDLGGHNVLVERITGKPVGMCGLLVQEVDGISELEIGYSLHPAFWGKGYATEAARKCRDFAFENNFAESLISIVHVDNTASAKVAMRNGMKLEKTTVYKGIPVNIFRIQSPFKILAK
jgi:[ribosomal protein S5]-alanine N-acetyltransferase